MSATDTPQEQRALKDIIRSVRAGKPTRAKLDELEKKKRRRTEATDEPAATNDTPAPESGDSLAKPSTPQNEVQDKQQENTQQSAGNQRELQQENQVAQPAEQDSDEVILGTVDDSDDEVPVNSHQDRHPNSLKGAPQVVSSQQSDQKKNNEKLAAEKNSQTQTPSKQLLDLTAPQVQFINGKIVIDQSSLVITAEPETTPIEEYNLVREGSAYLTSFTYSNRSMTERWSEAETTKFYQHLREFGTDFSMMARLFPNRTRNQLKNKYKREDRENPRLITAALSSRLTAQELLALVSSTIGNVPASQPSTLNNAGDMPSTQGQESLHPPLLVASKPDSVQPTQESLELHSFSEHDINTMAESAHTNAMMVSELQEPPNLITDGENENHLGDEEITPLDVLQQAASVAAKELEQQTIIPPTTESIDPFPLGPTAAPENLLAATCQPQEEINPGSLSPAESLY